ncbi:MAG: hypothetical protein QM652_05195 [Legionella sp.]|uniref:hypothetical protein n=1 Tax=Legionella sp. TaxID=459 RepID=UPI0039E6AC6C
MKLTKKIAIKTTPLCLALLASGVCFSSPVDKEELTQECKYLGTSLSQLANANTKEYCSVDMGYSGVMMGQSSLLIKANRIQFALDNLNFVYRTLERISSNHWECSYFSSMVMPFLEKTSNLARELESIAYVSSSNE